MASDANPLSRIPPVDERKLVCKIGDRFAVRRSGKTYEGDPIVEGSIYEVFNRKGYGWDLKLVAGEGASQLRIINSKIDIDLERLH
ncbi:MAG: hypothetical protein ABL866_17415 [Devosia sp.]